MNRHGQMLMEDGMELKEVENIKKLMKNMSWTIDQAMDERINAKSIVRLLFLTIN